MIDKPDSRTTMGKICLWKETEVWELNNMEVKDVAIDYLGARFLGTIEKYARKLKFFHYFDANGGISARLASRKVQTWVLPEK